MAFPVPPALQAPASLRPPDHAACRGFAWVASVVMKVDGTPIERMDLYLDPEALRREADTPEFRDLPPDEAAWRILRDAKIPLAWRMTYLQDVGRAYHSAKLKEILQAHWPASPFPSDHPVVRQFLQDLSGPRDASDPAEVILEGDVLRRRHRSEPWTTYHLRPLVVAIERSNLHLDAEQEAQLKRDLASTLVGPRPRR